MRYISIEKSDWNKNYGVVISSSKNDTANYEIKYKTNIVKNDNELIITQGDVYINNQLPQLKVEQLAYEINKALSPASFYLHRNGSLYALNNHISICNKWQATQHQMANYFVGEEAQKIIQSANNIIQSESNLFAHLKGTLFYTLFFLPALTDYSLEKVKKIKVAVPFSKSIGKIACFVDLQFNTSLVAQNKLLLFATGVNSYPMFLNQDLEAQEKYGAKIHVTYVLNVNDYTIHSIKGELSCTTLNNTERITFSCNQL